MIVLSVIVLMTTSCATSSFINTRAKFSAQEPTEETIKWAIKNAPEHVKDALKVCKFNARVNNNLNGNTDSTKVVVDTTWAKALVLFAAVYDYVALGFGWIINLF